MLNLVILNLLLSKLLRLQDPSLSQILVKQVYSFLFILLSLELRLKLGFLYIFTAKSFFKILSNKAKKQYDSTGCLQEAIYWIKI